MSTVYIPNIYSKVCTYKNELTQGNHVHYVTDTTIKIQRLFENNDIDYY